MDPLKKRRRRILKLLLLGATLFSCFLVAEIGARILTRRDVDGNIYFRNLHLKPHRIPVQRMQGFVDDYLASDDATTIYDPQFGWAPRPNVAFNNSQGIGKRDKTDATMDPADGVLRIAMFGGSYTRHGDYNFEWAGFVEKTLRDAGINAEVLNFGMAAYGMDQALLRYQLYGKDFSPHIVIFGYAPVNCYDNLCIFRPMLYPQTEVPFMKPRFVMTGDSISPVNLPTPKPEEITTVIADWANWPTSKHDHFYNPADYSYRGYRFFRSFAFVEAIWNDRRKEAARKEFYKLEGPGSQLALAILRQFRSDAEANGSAFYAVHLPTDNNLKAQRADGNFPYAELLAESKNTCTIIDPAETLIAKIGTLPISDLFEAGHYGGELHKVTGVFVGDKLIEMHPNIRDFPLEADAN